MTTFEIPTVTTERLRLRAFRASDLDAYAAMQANPEVMRHLVMGRTSTPAEVWRTMASSLGGWVLRGYGCGRAKKSTMVPSSAASASSSRSTGPNRNLPTHSTSPSGDRASRPKQPRRPATGSSSIFLFHELQALYGLRMTRRNASPSGWERFANAYSSCVAPLMNIGCIIGSASPRS